MKYFTFLISLLVILVFSSCEQNKIAGDGIVGFWTYSENDEPDTILIYTRVAKLPTDEYGMCFKTDGKFIEHKNAGWCGTPPIAYDTFEGSWTQLGDTLYISAAFWGGIMHMTKLINGVDTDHLRLVDINNEAIYTEEQ